MVMKGVIKLRRTSARDCPGELLREADFPICGVHLHWLAGVHPPACGEEEDAAFDRAKDGMW